MTVSFPAISEENPLKVRLRRGEVVVGAFMTISGPEVVEICGLAGCDFVIIDTEHTPVGWERISSMVLAGLLTDTCPIIRVASTRRDVATRALDTGARGIMYAQVPDAVSAREGVAGAMYPPEGVRGVIGGRAFGYGLRGTLPDYISAANRHVTCVVQVETRGAVADAEAMCAVPGVDCVFVGLSDLSVDLGHPGNFAHPEVEAALDRVVAAARPHGVAVGIPIADLSRAGAYRARGVRLFATTDRAFAANGATQFVKALRATS